MNEPYPPTSSSVNSVSDADSCFRSPLSQGTNNWCIWGIILSVISVFLCWLPIIGLFALVSLIVSVVGCVMASKKKQFGCGWATTGIILSSFTTMVAILTTSFLMMAYSMCQITLNEISQEVQDSSNKIQQIMERANHGMASNYKRTVIINGNEKTVIESTTSTPEEEEASLGIVPTKPSTPNDQTPPSIESQTQDQDLPPLPIIPAPAPSL